jgi:transposase-like protein
MKRNCPNSHCKSDQIKKNGFYKRANDSRKVQRFKCKVCNKEFSASTGTLEYNQKKRRVNYLLLQLFSSKVSQRRAAKIAKVNKNTVARKFDYWAKKAAVKNKRFKKKLKKNKATSIQLDDMITKEKTKLKPLSISVVSDKNRRFILGAKVSQIPSFGHLAKKSVNKYGYRKSYHMQKLDELFSDFSTVVCKNALIESDMHQNYEPVVKKYFPQSQYNQFKSERGCIAGQGELKKTKFDPLNSINHTLAMLRDGISTLVRRSWAVTQDPKRLQGHLEIYMYYHNQIYLRGLAAP